MSTPLNQLNGPVNLPKVALFEDVELPDNNVVSDTLNNSSPSTTQETDENLDPIKDLPNNETVSSLNLVGSYQAYLLNKSLPPKPPKPAPVPTISKLPSLPSTPKSEKKSLIPETPKKTPDSKPTIPPATVNTNKYVPKISSAEAGIFVNKYSGDINGLGKELSQRLLSPNADDKDLVSAALIYINKNGNEGPAISGMVAKQIIDNIPADGLFKPLTTTPEGARAFYITRSYLNINGDANSNEIARLNKALASSSDKTGKPQGISSSTQITEPQITASNGRYTLTLKSVSKDYKSLTPEQFFAGGSKSLAAISIGSAEGNRTPQGGYNIDTYKGHYDPNNGKRNIGSFSNQNVPPGTSPEAADQAQIKLLQSKVPAFVEAAKKNGLDPNNPILLANYLDLYNQAYPTTAVRFLNQLPNIAKEGVSNESILRARVNTLRETNSDQSLAKSAFRSVEGLRYDQIRRMNSITDTLKLNGYVTVVDRVASKQNGTANFVIKDQSVILSDQAKIKLTEISKTYFEKTGKQLVITDGNRKPHDQAERLYDKIRTGGDYVYQDKQLLGEVRQAYFAGKKEGKSRNEIVSDITTVVQKQVDRKDYISLHLLGGASDISFRDLDIPALREAARKAGIADKDVVKENDHIHIQFR